MPNHIKNILTLDGHKLYIGDCLSVIKNNEVPADADYNSIDFNKITPMPASLDIEESSTGERAMIAYMKACNPGKPDPTLEPPERLTHNRYEEAFMLIVDENMFRTPDSLRADIETFKYRDTDDRAEMLKKGEIYVRNLLNYGASTWYSWCKKNWGTKWNAYDFSKQESIDNKIVFFTANSAPIPVIKALSEKYPDIEFTLEYSDEDFGANTGVITFVKGAVVSENIPRNHSKDAYEMAARIQNVDLNDEYDFDEKSGTYVYREE